MTVLKDRVKLSALCDLVTHQVDPTTTPGSLYVGLEHVESGKLRRSGAGRAADVQSNKYAFQPNDILYGKLRPYLDKAVIAEESGVCTTELLVLRPKLGVDPRFLACVVHDTDFIDHALTGVTGAHHPRTSWNHIAQFEIPPHSPQEQRSIGALLWQINSLLIANEKSIEVGAQLKVAAMRELFTRGLRSKTQQDTEIGLIPEAWAVSTLGNVREFLQYGTSTRCTVEKLPFAVLRIPNVGAGRVNTIDMKYCDLSKDEAAKYILEDGDLLFIRTNGVLERLGSCAVYSGEPEKALFASYLIRARLKQDVDPRYIAYFYGSERGTSLVAGRATPAADGKFNLNTGTIDALPLPLPPTVEEQREIVAILDAIDRKIDLHKQKRLVLEQLFKSLLHKLMTAEIRMDQLDLSALKTA